MKRFIILFTLCLLTLPSPADVLYLNEGEEHVGRLISIADGKIRFQEASGTEAEFKVADVAHVLLSQIREGDEISHVASLTEPMLVQLLASAPQATDFPDSDFITLYRLRDFTFHPDGRVSYMRRRIVKVLKEPGLDEANQSLYYFRDREKLDLNFAHTYNPDGRIYHLTDDALSEETLYPNLPEYDFLNKVKFAMKKVDLGSVVDIKHQVETRDIGPLNPYIIDTVFGEREPVLHHEVVVRMPATMPWVVERDQWPQENSERLTFSDTVENGQRIIRAVFHDREGYIPEQNMMPRYRIFPRLLMTPQHSWDAIARELDKGLAAVAPSDALLNAFIRESGVEKAVGEYEKARVLYDYLLRRIQLVGVSLGDYGRYVPPALDGVLTRKYASAFARVALMHFALKKLGIASAIGFVDAWQDAGLKERIPSLGQAADAVLRVTLDGRTFYLTLDSDYLSFGVMQTAYQGARAGFLIDGRMVFETLPEGLEWNVSDQQVFVKVLEDGSFEVKEIRNFRGIHEPVLRSGRSVKEKQKLQWAQGLVKRVHPKGVLIDYSMTDINDLTAPVCLALTYRIPEAAIKAGEHLLAFKNFWVRYGAGSASLEKRKYPMEYSAWSDAVHNVVFELPEGFRWVPWGRSFNYACGFLSFAGNLMQKGRMVSFSDRLTVQRKELDVKDAYPHYRACLTRMADLSNQWLIIERVPTTPTASSTAPVVPVKDANPSR